jgi:hypothetical protein
MRTVIVVTAVALLAAGVSPTVVHADPVTDCAAIEGKAFQGIFVALFKEIGRACAKGSAGHPGKISNAAIAAMVNKVYAAVGKGVDKSGPDSCWVRLDNLDVSPINLDPRSVLQQAINGANLVCLVP